MLIFTYNNFCYNSIVMKFVDCFMYYDEDMILDIRLNILDKFVSNFVICEANFNHNGTKKKYNFDIKKFSKFKDKIIYLTLNEQPNNLRIINDNDNQQLKNSKILDNALLRENSQRNYLQSKIKDFQDDDFIIISDVDEIPNLEKFSYKAKISFFEQKMFCFKFNLLQRNLVWYGSKITKKKHLLSPQWLRNVKSTKYPIWRFDTLLSKSKYSDINFIKDGGWHFTNVKSAEKIDYKMKNFLHHLEYEKSGLDLNDVKKIISEKKVFYDHSVDKREKKWNKQIQLLKVDDSYLPYYLIKNKEKFSEWFD